MDKLSTLLKSLPEAGEVEAINNYLDANPDAVLGKVEEFIHEISSIPQLETRLKCFMHQQQMPSLLESIQNQLEVLSTAMDEMNNSAEFKRILCIVLAVGNTLNAGSNRGEAYGFKLETLTKLKDTKTSEKDVHLLHFIALKISELEKEFELNLLKAMPHVEAASKLYLDELKKDFAAIQSASKQCKTSLQSVRDLSVVVKPTRSTKKQAAMDEQIRAKLGPNAKPAPAPAGPVVKEQDFFHIKMAPFVESIQKKVDEVGKIMEDVLDKKFIEFVRSFGEPDSTTPEQFFSIIVQFSHELFTAHTQNQKRIKDKEKAKEKEKSGSGGITKRKPKTTEPKPIAQHNTSSKKMVSSPPNVPKVSVIEAPKKVTKKMSFFGAGTKELASARSKKESTQPGLFKKAISKASVFSGKNTMPAQKIENEQIEEIDEILTDTYRAQNFEKTSAGVLESMTPRPRAVTTTEGN
eukprot:c18694_g1_i1.p1 GENE.c18694_g1_i1~~c18694_g1_i1.p1  ORF type:complete len:497 (-),score=209.05 c18694_g1_i1:63-1457(-)